MGSQLRITAHGSPLAVLTVEFHELYGGRVPKFYAQVAGDLPQGVVKMWKMVDGHVPHEGGPNFVVARTAMQPPEKDEELDERGETDDDPVRIHESVFGRRFNVSAIR
jgi:hypothetical protein